MQIVNDDQKTEIHFGDVYIDACSQKMKGNYEEAKKGFEECVKLNPKNYSTYYELASIYKISGKPQDALYNAKICAASNPKNEWYQLLLAECFDVLKQHQQAIKTRENLLKNFPDNLEFKEDLAYEYIIVGEYEKAIKLYNEIEKRNGITETSVINKVKLYQSAGRMKDAENEWLKLIETDKTQIRYYNYLADFYFQTNQKEKAKNCYDKILGIDPENGDVYLALHDYYLSKGMELEAFENLQKAISKADLEIEIKKQILQDYFSQAQLGNKNALEQGILLSNLAIKTSPNSSVINLMCGDFNRINKNSSEAIKYYYKANVSDENNFNVWQSLIVAENELHLYDSVAKHSNKAIELFPTMPILFLYNGEANTQLKNYPKAIQSLKYGLELSMGNKKVMIDFLSLLGDDYYAIKDFSNSDKSFEEALKLDSDNTLVLNNYAYYLSERKTNLELAVKYSKRANDLQANNANFLDTYAWVLFQQKNYLQALIEIEKAEKIFPSPTILEHHGDILFHVNKTEEAMQLWNRAKQAGNKSELLNKKIANKKWYE